MRGRGGDDRRCACTGHRARQAADEATPAKRRVRPPKTTVAQVAAPPENGARGATLGDLSEAWLKHVEAIGKSRGTIFGYSILGIALKHFGADASAAGLTTRNVQNYFDSDEVTVSRAGRAKAKPTIDKTRRAFRLASRGPPRPGSPQWRRPETQA